MRRQKLASCTDSDYKKMANLGDKDKFRQKMASMPKLNSSRVWPNNQMK